MTVIRCTSKLLKLVAGSPVTRSMEPADGDWYANLLWFDGRKCLLMTHAATLFGMFEPDITKSSVTPIGPLALSLIERELAAEELPPDTFGSLEASAFEVGRTWSRSVLGTMTDIRYQVEAAVHQSGGLRHLDLAHLNRSLRRIPFSAIKYDRPIDRARARLDGEKGGTGAATSQSVSETGDRINDLLGRFLAERRERLSSKELRNYEAIIDFFTRSLNGYAYESLSPLDRKRWERAFNAGDEDAYCKLFGAGRIPGEVGGLVGYFMIRKVAASSTVVASTGRVISDLLDWLVEQGLVKPEDVADAKERAEATSSDLPRAEKLAGLLYELAERSTVNVHEIADEDYIEDHLTISRVEPDALWFEGHKGEIGPLQVGQAISRLARPGWSVSIVMGRVDGRWHVVEVGSVYPD